MFLLTKWYLDLVTEDGVAFIAYAARLKWGVARLGYASALLAAPECQARETATARGVVLPRVEDDATRWECGPLGLRGEWRRLAPPIRETLIRSPEGSIHWFCRMPRARATVRFGDTLLEGAGYVECLRLTLPPWRLPFDALWWGRHLSDRHSVVWIQWDGRDRRTWIWLDGLLQPRAHLGPDGIAGLDRGAELRLGDRRGVRDRRVLAALGDLAPALTRRLAGSLGRMHERKQLSRSTLADGPDRPADSGWSLHEEVTW